MKTKVFEPTAEGINANNYPQKKEGPIRISLHNREWNDLEKFFTATCLGQIKGFSASFDVSLAYIEGFKNTFILSIDNTDEGCRVSKKLPLEGFGAHLYYDLTFASHHIATEFCKINKLKICAEVGHWPILQYVVENY